MAKVKIGRMNKSAVYTISKTHCWSTAAETIDILLLCLHLQTVRQTWAPIVRRLRIRRHLRSHRILSCPRRRHPRLLSETPAPSHLPQQRRSAGMWQGCVPSCSGDTSSPCGFPATAPGALPAGRPPSRAGMGPWPLQGLSPPGAPGWGGGVLIQEEHLGAQHRQLGVAASCDLLGQQHVGQR